VVNTGFADIRDPERLREPAMALQRSVDYWFCVEIGEPLSESAEPERTTLPIDQLPAEASLVVALFSFPGELEVDNSCDTGTLRLRSDGGVTVSTPAGVPSQIDPDLADKRLFFPIRTPVRAGRPRLRCNIYCQGILVQSRLVTARVMRTPRALPHAIRTKLEYTLSRAIGPDIVAMPHHKLSLMMNGPGDGTHSFRVLAHDGKDLVKTDSSFDGQALANLLDKARGAMRMAAWGDEDEWSPEKTFRYDGGRGVNIEQLRRDLARLAIEGYRIFTFVVDGLRGSKTLETFEDVMRAPGYVQLASQNARMLVPLSVVYDYAPFDDTASLDSYELCTVFRRALEDRLPLQDLECLQGVCPSRGEDRVVCPSGFWGYRHFLGMPLSSTVDVAPILSDDENRRVVFGSANELDQVAEHANALRPLATEFEDCSTRGSLLKALRKGDPHVVYLYCHGGIDRTLPFILVGAGDDGPITRAYLYRRVNWTAPRPLVFINGCHTTAVRPDQAFDLVSAFVQQSNAAGVIGTEITIVEYLARAFGEEFLQRFAAGQETVGQAVRGTRLTLLQGGNPLGLVYAPFSLAGLRMGGELPL
jgi:hypothetical protein